MAGEAALLVRRPAPLPAPDLLAAEARRAFPARGRLQVCVALDDSVAYFYLWGCEAALPGAMRLAPLEEFAGASAGEAARYLYVVEMDGPAQMDAWYRDEHLAGLASVAGNVRSRRLRNLDGEPSSHACHALVSPAVLDAPEWKRWRVTPWANALRPQFRNQRRTVFRSVLEELVAERPGAGRA